MEVGLMARGLYGPITHEELLPIQLQLASQVLNDFSEQESNLLLSIKAGEPDWSLMPISGINDQPGIQWKLQNINKMKKKKRLGLLDKLKSVLNG
jgi:hypothetical protein